MKLCLESFVATGSEDTSGRKPKLCLVAGTLQGFECRISTSATVKGVKLSTSNVKICQYMNIDTEYRALCTFVDSF